MLKNNLADIFADVCIVKTFSVAHVSTMLRISWIKSAKSKVLGVDHQLDSVIYVSKCCDAGWWTEFTWWKCFEILSASNLTGSAVSSGIQKTKKFLVLFLAEMVVMDLHLILQVSIAIYFSKTAGSQQWALDAFCCNFRTLVCWLCRQNLFYFRQRQIDS